MRNSEYRLLLRVSDQSLLHGPYRGSYRKHLDTSVGDMNTHRPLPSFDYSRDKPLDWHCQRFLENGESSKYLFGFLTPEQLCNWFKQGQRKAMLDKLDRNKDAFGINFIYVLEEDIGKFNNQCIFVPSESVRIAGSLSFTTSNRQIKKKWEELSNTQDHSAFMPMNIYSDTDKVQDSEQQIEMAFDYDDDKDYDIEPVILSDYMLRDYK